MSDEELKRQNDEMRKEIARNRSETKEHRRLARSLDGIIKRIHEMAQRDNQETWKAGDK